MSSNNWYSGAGWYEPLHGEEKPKKRRKKGGWTPARIGGIIVLVLVLIAGTSLMFSNSGSSVSVIWNKDGKSGSWSSGSDELPEDFNDFFDSYYESTDTESAEINIPTVSLDTDFSVTLEKPGEQEMSLKELYSDCAQSIVAIYGYIDGQSGYYWGTGVILSEDGLILTNTHVVSGCDSATVQLSDNTEYEAKLVGADELSDIAVLKIEASGLKAARFGESRDLAVGDKVAAIGNPLGETFRLTLTDGIISAIERGISYKGHSMTLLQTNTAINEGNSGGALFNMYGQVIGITNMKMMSSYSSIEGIGFAIPSATACSIANSLIKYGEVWGRPSIGITVGAIPKNVLEHYDLPQGLYVSAVQAGSDAEKEGIQSGDIITAVNYQPVTTTDEVNDIKNSLAVGDIMIFDIWRNGETMEIEVVLMDTNDVYK